MAPGLARGARENVKTQFETRTKMTRQPNSKTGAGVAWYDELFRIGERPMSHAKKGGRRIRKGDHSATSWARGEHCRTVSIVRTRREFKVSGIKFARWLNKNRRDGIPWTRKSPGEKNTKKQNKNRITTLYNKLG